MSTPPHSAGTGPSSAVRGSNSNPEPIIQGGIKSGTESTPPKRSHRTSAANVRASHSHAVAALEIPIIPMDAAVLPPVPPVQPVTTTDIIHRLKSCKTEKCTYPYIALLLNNYSLAVYNQLFPNPRFDSNAIIYTFSSSERSLAGDVFHVKFKPDIVAATGSLEELKRQIAHLRKTHLSSSPSKGRRKSKTKDGKKFGAPPWASCLSPIEIKPNQEQTSGKPQIISYCDAVKRYRQDLARIFGLQGNKFQYKVVALDPLAMQGSEWRDWDESDDLIRYICAVYHSEGNKDRSILVPLVDQNLWEFNGGGVRLEVAPFYSSPALGRMTWVAIGGEDVGKMNRVLKVSWLDKARPWSEKDLYDHAHRDGWIPGLARHIQYMTTDDRIPDDTTREKCILELGSTGEPLSECGSILHFLKVMYDLIETHQHMCENDILHRDITWSNTLCNGRHHADSDSRRVLSRPCIATILGEADPESCVLLTDLDNGARMTRTTSNKEVVMQGPSDRVYQEKSTGRERTGTPLFMAMDIASATPFALQIVDPQPIFDSVALGSNQHYNDVAFPDGDGGFIDSFKRVCEAELARPRSCLMKRGGANDKPGSQIKWPIQHQPRHDVESVYWIIVWWLGRAQPVSSKEKSKEEATHELREDSAFQLFCTNLLKHEIGTSNEVELRGIYRPMLAAGWAQILHPGIAFLGPMLEHMGQYLSMDWDFHGSLVGEFHAHNAFKRLLLNEIVKLKDGSPIKTSSKPRKFDASHFKEPSSSLTDLQIPSTSNSPKKRARADSESSGSEYIDSTTHRDLDVRFAGINRFRQTAIDSRQLWFGGG